MTTPPTQPPAQGTAPKSIPQYFWKQIYQLDDDSVHWALCDTESEKEGKVSCCYMVLLADYPTAMDGRPVGEQYMPKRIVDALNTHATHLARIKVLTDLLTKFAAEDSQCDMEGFRKLKQQARAALTPSKEGPV